MTERLHFHFSLSCVGEGNGNPLQCSCLENPRDGDGAVYGVTQSQTRLKRLSSSSSSLPTCYPLVPPFSFRRIMLLRERVVVLKSVRQHILLTLVLRVNSGCISFHLFIIKNLFFVEV